MNTSDAQANPERSTDATAPLTTADGAGAGSPPDAPDAAPAVKETGDSRLQPVGPASEAGPSAGGRPSTGPEPDPAAPLFAAESAESFRSRWQEIQTSFVDEPRRAVEQAEGLVAELMQQLAKTFADERSQLDRESDRGDALSTEDLRVALRRYRSFFDRMLSI